jgi:hypothetical protein
MWPHGAARYLAVLTSHESQTRGAAGAVGTAALLLAGMPSGKALFSGKKKRKKKYQ